MEQKVLAQYGAVVIYSQPNKTTPLYSVRVQPTKNPYGQLKPFLDDDQLEEIMVNGSKQSVKVVHRKLGMCETNVVVSDEEAIAIIRNLAAIEGKEEQLLYDGRLPDGSRVNATLPPLSPDGPTLTIRKFLADPLTIIDLINYGTMPSHIAALMWMWVEGLNSRPANIIISGGTGSGKTTLLNVLGMFIPWSKRLISIEDTAELQLVHEHWVRLESRVGKNPVTMNDLMTNILRMRPDRIVVGEVRGSEAQTLFTAMNTGHEGCLGTLHSNTAMETINRLLSPPMEVPHIMISGLDLIIMQARLHLGGRTARRITEIAEVGGMEGDRPRINTIFKLDPKTGNLASTGVPQKLREVISRAAGVSPAQFDAHVEQRTQILERLVAQGQRDVGTVSRVIQNFYAVQN